MTTGRRELLTGLLSSVAACAIPLQPHLWEWVEKYTEPTGHIPRIRVTVVDPRIYRLLWAEDMAAAGAV